METCGRSRASTLSLPQRCSVHALLSVSGFFNSQRQWEFKNPSHEVGIVSFCIKLVFFMND